MIKAPSLQAEYTLVYSGDPALNLPPLAPGESLTGSEREKALEVARETGNWAPLILSGETPTRFHVRPITGLLMDWLSGENSRRDLSTSEISVLALRLALRRIDGFGEHRVEFVRDGEIQLASLRIIEALYAIEGEVAPGRSIGRDIVQELGSIVLLRAFGALRPKS